MPDAKVSLPTAGGPMEVRIEDVYQITGLIANPGTALCTVRVDGLVEPVRVDASMWAVMEQLVEANAPPPPPPSEPEPEAELPDDEKPSLLKKCEQTADALFGEDDAYVKGPGITLIAAALGNLAAQGMPPKRAARRACRYAAAAISEMKRLRAAA